MLLSQDGPCSSNSSPESQQVKTGAYIHMEVHVEVCSSFEVGAVHVKESFNNAHAPPIVCPTTRLQRVPVIVIRGISAKPSRLPVLLKHSKQSSKECGQSTRCSQSWAQGLGGSTINDSIAES